MVCNRLVRNSILLVIAIAFFSACNKVPDHARYIPQDAVMVTGINLKSFSKKIAWNVITGSKLYKEMQARIPEQNAKDALSGIEAAGLDFTNTIYVYLKPDNRYANGEKMVGLVPLSDADKWEAFVKKTFPEVAITVNGERKEATLAEGMYVGWNKDLMVLINASAATDKSAASEQMDKATIAAEMENAFKANEGDAMTANKHFANLEKEGHDISFFINYEQMMKQMSAGITESVSVSLSGDMWKNSAFTTGLDFVKGKITADMHYYLSDEMKEIGTELGSSNADKDMIDRLPTQNMDMMVAVHLSPKGIKAILEKMNLLGFINMGLAAQGMSAEGVLDAFTGDMSFMMNDFSLQSENVVDTFMSKAILHPEQRTSLTMTYVIKLNKKENFKKIVKMAEELGLQKEGTGYIIPIDGTNSVHILMNDHYLVASNKMEHAKGVLDGKFKAEKKPEAVSSKVEGHPWAFYFDVQQFCKNIDPAITQSREDSLMILESKKLLKEISLTGGAFKNNAFEYHLDINFLNTDENAILTLMDYSMRMSDATKIEAN